MTDLDDKEKHLHSRSHSDTKLDIMQFAHREMHTAKEDIREMLRADIDGYKTEIGKRDRRIVKIAVVIVSSLIDLIS